MRSILMMICFLLLPQAFQPVWAGIADADLSQLQRELQQVHKLESAGNTAAAIKRYEALIKLHPQEPVLFNNLAVLMAKEGKLDAALERLEQAMHADQLYATVYENLSAVYVEMARGSYARALQLGVVPQQLSLKEVKLETKPAQDTGAKQKVQKLAAAVPVPAEKSTARSKQQDKDILLTLQGWASAWSAQQVDLYLSFYAADFQPARGLSRSRWAQQRSRRLRRPAWVKVTLNNFQILPTGEGLARVRFLQHYQSDRYQDRSKKEIVLKSSPEGWRILSERSL